MSAPVATSIAGLFVDHSDLQGFNQVVALNAFRTAGVKQAVPQSFWSTENRAASSPVQDTLEISLTSTRLVNWLEFDVARFPHTIAVQYYDDKSQSWVPLLDVNRMPVATAVLHSVPTQLLGSTAIPGHLHPQHSYVGHWETLQISTVATYLQRLRIILQRIDNGHGPVDSMGNPANYSLAIRNLAFGYEVTGQGDVPRTLAADDDTYTLPFAATNDLVDSSINYALRRSSADRVLGNTDTDADTVWMCEPQPYPDAVVCFYVDLRKANGDPQIIDQIYLNPVNNGAHVTLYYSNDTPVGGFDASALPLSTTQAPATGNVTVGDGRLHFGKYGDQAYLTIYNAATNDTDASVRHKDAIGYEPTLPWWFGVTVRPGFNPGRDANEHPILDCGAWRLSLVTAGVQLTTSHGDTLLLPISYQSGQDTNLIVSYDGQGNVHMHGVNTSDEQVLDATLSVLLDTAVPPVLTLGATLDGVYRLNSQLLHLVLKEEVAPDDGFLSNPAAYCTVAQFEGDELPQTRNALLRLDLTAVSLIDVTRPWGLFGGPAAKFEAMAWTPIPRDYTMQRGIMQLPETKAKFWKLEITHLQAHWHAVHVPSPQVVKRFPPDVLDAYRRELEAAPAAQLLGPATEMSLGSISPYVDFPTNVSTGGTGLGYTNAETYVAQDYSTAQRLRQMQGDAWAYQDWHPEMHAPRFSVPQVHTYTEETVVRTSTIAYSVGIRQLTFGRSSFSTQQDTDLYEDMFFDDLNLAKSNFVYDPVNAALTSGSSDKAVATSLTFPSQRNLRGVQFSTQQSQPSQLLADEEFQDPQYLNWVLYGDAQVPTSLVQSPVLGSLLPIVRNLVLGFWGDIAPVYPTWGDLMASGVTYGQLRATRGQSQTQGGIESLPVSQIAGGRMYAAARVVADRDLSSPLWVQIVDATTGQVLAEESADVRREQVTEWYTSYSVGGGGQYTPNTWGDIDGASHADRQLQTFTDSFQRANATSLGQMDSGQSWIENLGWNPVTISGDRAVVVTGGDRSLLRVGTPWGTLAVTLSNTVTTTVAGSSYPLLILGDYWLMNDGRIVDTNTSRTMATLVGITSGDQLTIDFKLASALTTAEKPSGLDTTITPWAMVIYRNGTFDQTIVTEHGFTDLRGISGAAGQAYASFSWTPSDTSSPTGVMIDREPIGGNDVAFDGTGSYNVDSSVWTQANGQQFVLSPPGGITVFDAGYQEGNATGYQPNATGAVIVSTDVRTIYGTFGFRPIQPAGATPTDSYYVALLDQYVGVQLYLRADGALVQESPGLTTVLAGPGFVPSVFGSDLSFKYASTANLSSTFKSTYGIPSNATQALIVLANGAVVAVYSGSGFLQGTVRGVCLYNDGAGNYSTSYGFAWTPDITTLYSSTSSVTWGDVAAGGTVTWGDLVGETPPNADQVIVRVVQKAASVDSWYMDTLSLYADPIVWEFSNDGGKKWVPAYEIRNNPTGVLLFPPLDPSDPVGNQLRYRVTAYAPNAWISHLAIRPWYQGFMHDVPARPQATVHGPNINPWDHYPPIDQDPRWRTWHLPVPREWWFAFRNLQPQDFVTPIITDGVVIQ